jgi:hypothetical protein
MISFAVVLSTSLTASTWFAPFTGRALNQNELTYNSDVSIVTVSAGSNQSKRPVGSRSGTLELNCTYQAARVKAASFGHAGAVALSFLESLHYKDGSSREKPGALSLPLPAGDYLVLGSWSANKPYFVESSVVGYGIADDQKPPVNVLRLEPKQPNEYAVFCIVPIKVDAVGASDLVSPMMALVKGINASDRDQMDLITRLLISTNHVAFAAWAANAKAPAEELYRKAQLITGYERARMLCTSVAMGQFDASEEAIESVVTSDIADPQAWKSWDAASFLQISNLVPSNRTVEMDARLASVERQQKFLKLAAAASSPVVRGMVLRYMTDIAFTGEKASYMALLDAAEANGYRGLLLERLATWFDQPDKSPSVEGSDEALLVSYWKNYLKSLP